MLSPKLGAEDIVQHTAVAFIIHCHCVARFFRSPRATKNCCLSHFDDVFWRIINMDPFSHKMWPYLGTVLRTGTAPWRPLLKCTWKSRWTAITDPQFWMNTTSMLAALCSMAIKTTLYTEWNDHSFTPTTRGVWAVSYPSVSSCRSLCIIL